MRNGADRAGMDEVIERSQQAEGLQQPDDDCDDDDNADDLLDGRVHWDELHQIEHQPDDYERDDDANKAGREHARILLLGLDAGLRRAVRGLGRFCVGWASGGAKGDADLAAQRGGDIDERIQ